MRTLAATVERHRMWSNGATVVVAVSGGQDSLALLHALHSVRERWDLDIRAAHYNHQMRGNESDEDARHVNQICRSWDIPCSVGTGSVLETSKRLHRSKQSAARDLRWSFLEGVAEEAGAACIVVGHTRDDRIETVLLNLIRGTGVDGLHGMSPVSGNRVRPLIEVARADTGDYCRRHAIPFCSDPSNLSTAYTRNRVREELLPHLAEYYNPGIRGSLERLADLASEDSAFLQEEARRRYNEVVQPGETNGVTILIEDLKQQPLAMRRRIVRLAIDKVRGTLQDIDFEMSETLIRALQNRPENARFQFTLPPGDIKGECNGDKLVFRRVRSPASPLPVCIPLTVPGVTPLRGWGMEIAATVGLWDTEERGPNVAWMDADSVSGRLTVRNLRVGDRMQPLGMVGTRKVQDILVDLRVPREQRSRVPIVTDDEGIVWLTGLRLSDRVKVRPDTKRALRLELGAITASNGALET